MRNISDDYYHMIYVTYIMSYFLILIFYFVRIGYAGEKRVGLHCILYRVFSPVRERADNLSLMKKTLFLHSFYEITK